MPYRISRHVNGRKTQLARAANLRKPPNRSRLPQVAVRRYHPPLACYDGLLIDANERSDPVSVRNFLLLALTATLLMVRSAVAQPEARFQVVQTGVDPLKADLKYLVELSPSTALKKQWKETLEPLLDSFAEGLDPTKPIRVDVIVGKDIGYEMHFPISKLDKKGGFIPNITGFGFNVKSLGPDLYSVTQAGGKGAAAKNPMFMRYVNGYASIAMTQAAVPANMPHPITDKDKGVQPLIDKGYDVIGSMKNGVAPADLATRRKNFLELRKQLEAGLAFKRNEDKNDFAMRKLALVQNLDEGERFVVETEELTLGWTTTIADKDPGRGRAEFSISAIPGTDLAKSTEILAAKPSYFANVELSKTSVISGKLNFAVDALRVAHLKELYSTVRPVVEARIDKRPTIKEPAQKKAAKQAAGLLIDMLNEGLELGVADLFLDVRSAGDGKHTLICGVRSANGKKADELVKLLPQITVGRDVKLDIQKIGEDVSVHSVAIPKHRQEAFQKVFPGETMLYVATSKNAVWGAAGVNALAELEAAIKQTASAAPETVDPRVAYFSAHAGKLVDLIEIAKPEPQKIDTTLSKDEQKRLEQLEKDLQKIRKLAVDATADCDAVFSGEVKKVGNKVEGSIDVSECVLKFIGSVTADFSKIFQ